MAKTKFQTEMPKPDTETSNVTNPKMINEVSKFYLAVKVHWSLPPLPSVVFCRAEAVAWLRFSNLVSQPLGICMMQQRERQIWAGKRGIFRPLRWDLYTSDRRTGKRVIHASADRDLKRLHPLLWNILAFAVRWFDSEPAIPVFFSSGTPPPALTRWKYTENASKWPEMPWNNKEYDSKAR